MHPAYIAASCSIRTKRKKLLILFSNAHTLTHTHIYVLVWVPHCTIKNNYYKTFALTQLQKKLV